MPLIQCSASGAVGWKWGASGKCFIGGDARSRASAQGRAIESSIRRGAEADVGDVHVPQHTPSERLKRRGVLTPGGKFAKGNKSGTPKKKNPKSKPFAERNEYERMYDRRAVPGESLAAAFEQRSK